MSFLLGRSSTSFGRPATACGSSARQAHPLSRSHSVLYDADEDMDGRRRSSEDGSDDELEAAFGDAHSSLGEHDDRDNNGHGREDSFQQHDEQATLLGGQQQQQQQGQQHGEASSSYSSPRPSNAGGYDFERDPYDRAPAPSAAASSSNLGQSTSTSSTSHSTIRNFRNRPPPSALQSARNTVLARIQNALPSRFQRYGLLSGSETGQTGRRRDGTTNAGDEDDDDDHWDAPPPSMPGYYGGGTSNDGVFSNMAAKPGNYRNNGARGGLDMVGGDDEAREKEIPPAYEMAVLDAAPPYFDTTVHAPGLGGLGGTGAGGMDEILIEGLPLGNIFSFFWSLLVSMSFQFVGFLLTTLLSTSHAAKNGSRAGLGITLIQYGLYLESHENDSFENYVIGAEGGDAADKEQWSQMWGNVGGSASASAPAAASPTAVFARSLVKMAEAATNSSESDNPVLLDGSAMASNVAASWFAMLMMIVGWFLLVSSVVSYLKCIRYAKLLRDGAGNPESLAEQGAVMNWLSTRIPGVERLREAAASSGAGGRSSERVWGLPSRPAPGAEQEAPRTGWLGGLNLAPGLGPSAAGRTGA